MNIKFELSEIEYSHTSYKINMKPHRSKTIFDYFNITPKDAYLSVLKDFNVPILLDIDLGHLGPSMPIRCGAKATIEYKKNTICIKYDE